MLYSGPQPVCSPPSAPKPAYLSTLLGRVVDCGAFVQGRETEALEAEFAEPYGVRHALAVNTGTAALHLALIASGVGPGDEVITVANTFIATAEAISQAGATPVFAAIEPTTMNIDPASVEERITERTRGVIAVHLYGQMADMAAPQLLPYEKPGTVGEGGMLLTDIATRVASLRNHGQAARRHHVERGYNYRLPELQAALRVFLPYLDGWNRARIEAAARYDERLAWARTLAPAPATAGEHSYHLYVVRSAAREPLQAYLGERRIATASHYPTPIHLQPAYANEGMPPGSLPQTERAVQEILALPMHASISADETDTVRGAVLAFEEYEGPNR